MITWCSEILEECGRRRSRQERENERDGSASLWGKWRGGGGVIYAKLIHRPRCEKNLSRRESAYHIHYESQRWHANSAITAILNSSNHNRYRAPDLIRFHPDSAYVFLRPLRSDSGERRNWIGQRGALKRVVIGSGRVWVGDKWRLL